MTQPSHGAPSSLVNPPYWLIYGLAWPAGEADFAEAAVAVAPTAVPRHVLSRAAADVFDLTIAIARQNNWRAVFLSDITQWLDTQQRTWADIGIDYEQVCNELSETPILQLFLTLSQLGYALLCDASRNGLTIHTANGTWQTGLRERDDLRAQLSDNLARDWPPYATSVFEKQAGGTA
ncbi:hypothetical protein [Nocardia bovistercoris]|uniref:Uncharacterized protein n=1 Tax=Nocardia bovistercoris TaxID=2785916 RepID=A0A931IGX9_9NOCA|nr:hypothetical protein [Nocardia bovistercoris]MBH0781557.1 hypothetical protein [Nocardia bovistercoris]